MKRRSTFSGRRCLTRGTSCLILRRRLENPNLSIAKSKRWTAKKLRKAIGEHLEYIEKAQGHFAQLMVLAPEVKLPNWLLDRLQMIPLVYSQQKEMYEHRTHTCKDRIVSLSQPFVRPINRGKRPNPTEFGQKLHLSVVEGYTFLEQTCWSNYNETAKAEAALNILAMNAAHRLRRCLMRIFRFSTLWAVFQ